MLNILPKILAREENATAARLLQMGEKKVL